MLNPLHRSNVLLFRQFSISTAAANVVAATTFLMTFFHAASHNKAQSQDNELLRQTGPNKKTNIDTL